MIDPLKEALACPCNCSDASCDCKAIIVAAIREQREKLEKSRAEIAEARHHISLQGLSEQARRAERAESRLKTLEEENARMRKALFGASGAIKILDRNRTHGDGVDMILDQIDAALKQEAE